MFRFLDLSLHGWDLWPAVRIPLEADVVIVCGPNGSGKTTLLDAIRQLVNAPRLSSRRRLQHYLRTPGAPALLWAAVSNESSNGSAPPFARERVRTPVATLACALVPGGGGAPEKRFAILEGRQGVDVVRRALLESRDFYGPERYARALEHAGVTRSLMNVLAIEQGRTDALFELKPRELFTRVLDMLGDRAVLERYREARRRFEESEDEVTVQTRALAARQAELAGILREVERLSSWERQSEKVAELEARLPAAELQRALAELRGVTAKLPELRTKVQRGAVEIARRDDELRALREREAEAARERDATREREREADEVLQRALVRAASLHERVAALEVKAGRARALPERDLAACERGAGEAWRALFGLEAKEDQERAELAALEARCERLRAGLPDYPESVRLTLEALGREGIESRVLAERVEVADPSLSAALEAALDDARFALVVAPQREARALEIARAHGFPGPVDASPALEAEALTGPLRLAAGSPRWLEDWLRATKLAPDGGWRDERGAWVRPPRGSALGAAGREAALAYAETLCEERGRSLEELAGGLHAAREERARAEAALSEERERRALLREAEGQGLARAELEQATELESHARTLRAEARRERQAAEERAGEIASQRRLADERLGQLRAQHEGERQSLHELERRSQELEPEALRLRSEVAAPLRARAERGELEGVETVRRDLERALHDLERMGAPPPPEIREEARHLEANVSELEGHVAQRRSEAVRARSELDACRARYLEIVAHAIRDYRQRATEIAERAEVSVEMDLPALENDDRVLDEAALRVRFGFDGKEPLPLGDPSFSGGQQVIAGLVLLMAMAETGGSGFFMLDEPFAHLSLDRIDQVGRFLRSTRAQFILTAPTTLDRAQLDAASELVVLRKKRPTDARAPVPLVAGA